LEALLTMSLSGYWSDLLSWQAPGSTDAAQALSNQLDAQNAAGQQAEIAKGLYTQAQQDAVNAETADTTATGIDVAGQIDSSFVQGAQQGLQAELALPGQIVGAAGSGASSLLWGILKNIPWWVWLVGAGALFVWMGGLELLEGSLSRGRRS
jgi:hypothetical protein